MKIELIGIDSSSRMRLLDGFIPSNIDVSLVESQLKSAQSEVSALQSEIANLDEQLAALAPIAAELIAAKLDQQNIIKGVQALVPDQKRLKALTEQLTPLARDRAVLDQYASALESWVKELRRLIVRLPTAPDSVGVAIFEASKAALAVQKSVSESLSAGETAVSRLLAELKTASSQLGHKIEDIESRTRPIRSKLEELNKGSGELARRIASLEKRVAQGEALAVVRNQRIEQLQTFRKERNGFYETLKLSRSKRSSQRSATARRLTVKLQPSIRVDVLESGNLRNYETNIEHTLRGSGLHAATLASQIASRIPPQQLIQIVEEGDRSTLSRLASLSSDRAHRLLAALSKADTSALLASEVDDDVRYALLDGADYKTTENLSTGQRCTVILPILLETEVSTLVIDQPEDHLDNAFIVDTLIKAITNRNRRLQLIFSTHNANLPVLGNADLVTQMNSDGRHGFKQVAGALEDPLVVSAIAKIMEGGKEAFERRARFYHEHAT